MTNIIREHSQECYEALYSELEKRYGPYAAQEITDQIRKADAQGHVPDYMHVKAVSEALELLRLELRNAIHRLKVVRHEETAWPDGVADLEAQRLQHDVKRLLPLYRLLAHGYYRLHAKAMAVYEVPGFDRRKRSEPEKAAA